jgi:hypothetical protein
VPPLIPCSGGDPALSNTYPKLASSAIARLMSTCRSGIPTSGRGGPFSLLHGRPSQRRSCHPYGAGSAQRHASSPQRHDFATGKERLGGAGQKSLIAFYLSDISTWTL